MARIRSLKPEFFLDEDLAALPFSHRLCFQGLWCEADKDGRLEDRPKRLKATIFPYDDVDMDDMLWTLSVKFITRYEVDGKRYIQINNFGKHQRPHHTEAASVLPVIDENASVVVRELTVKQPLDNGEHAEGREGKGKVIGREGNRKGSVKCPSRNAEFEMFWDAFNYKKGIKGALQSWYRISMTEELFSKIIEGAKREASNRQALIARGSTPKMAQGWLTEMRWEDEHIETPVISLRESINRSAVDRFVNGHAL